jgi:hypothetical protein
MLLTLRLLRALWIRRLPDDPLSIEKGPDLGPFSLLFSQSPLRGDFRSLAKNPEGFFAGTAFVRKCAGSPPHFTHYICASGKDTLRLSFPLTHSVVASRRLASLGNASASCRVTLTHSVVASRRLASLGNVSASCRVTLTHSVVASRRLASLGNDRVCRLGHFIHSLHNRRARGLACYFIRS